MELIPTVRLAAGLPPLVTPTSQIVGAQAVNCALDEKAGRPMYTNTSMQFAGLVKGEYGHTPVKVDPEFRFKICGVREETPYDTSKYKTQPNPTLPEAGGVKLAENEKEELLLELFPSVAKTYLTNLKKKAYEAKHASEAASTAAASGTIAAQPIVGFAVDAPLPGRVVDIKVKVGQTVKTGDVVATLEAMKMQNAIVAECDGVVRQILVKEGDAILAGAHIIEIADSAQVGTPAAGNVKPAAQPITGYTVDAPLPGRVVDIKVKAGDKVANGDTVVVLEAMKMENTITTSCAGTVKQVLVSVGDAVPDGAHLVEIDQNA